MAEAKVHKLSTEWSVKSGVLSITVNAREADADKDAPFVATIKRELNLPSTFGDGYSALNEAGQAALNFGAYTALRNSTGSARDASEAEAAIDKRLEAWESGEWGSEREPSATPFTANHLLAKAIAQASKGSITTDEAADKLCAMAEATCKASDLPEFTSLESDDRAKVRKAVLDNLRKNPAVDAAYTLLDTQRAAEAIAKRNAAAQKKAEASADAFSF